MRKLAAALLGLLLLGGCAPSAEDLPDQILTQLQALPQMKLVAGNNMTKKYYTYYLPAGIGRRDSNDLSEVFVKNGYRLIMNFDPSAIVIDTFYKEKADVEEDKAAEVVEPSFLEPKLTQEEHKSIYTGNYLTSDGNVLDYTLQVIESDDRYLLYMDGTVVKLYTYVPRAEVSSSLKMMVRIMASIRYDEDLLLQDYSLKSINETNKKSLDYLEQHLPSSGTLNDLLNGKEDNPQSNSGDSTE